MADEQPPEPEHVLDLTCQGCGSHIDLRKLPQGVWRWCSDEDGSWGLVCTELRLPIDPMLVPYIQQPIVGHRCSALARQNSVVEEAESILNGGRS